MKVIELKQLLENLPDNKTILIEITRDMEEGETIDDFVLQEGYEGLIIKEL